MLGIFFVMIFLFGAAYMLYKIRLLYERRHADQVQALAIEFDIEQDRVRKQMLGIDVPHVALVEQNFAPDSDQEAEQL